MSNLSSIGFHDNEGRNSTDASRESHKANSETSQTMTEGNTCRFNQDSLKASACGIASTETLLNIAQDDKTTDSTFTGT